MQRTILERLMTDCPFGDVFEDTACLCGSIRPEPRRKIGHLRADHDGFRWWSTWWPCHPELMGKSRSREINDTFDSLISRGAFPGLNSLCRFCGAHPEACAGPMCPDEFNFFLVGSRCYYWLRLITREKDYNMYLHCYTKE